MQTIDLRKESSGKLWKRKAGSDIAGCTLVLLSKPHVTALTFDLSGKRLLLADAHGHVFICDLEGNNYKTLVQVSGTVTTAAFISATECLLALTDGTVHAYNADNGEHVATLKGHHAPVQYISVHASGRYAITCGSDTANLWELATFERKRKLNVKENVNIVKVFFIPLSDLLVTCFADDSIFVWDIETLACQYELDIPQTTKGLRAFAADREGRLLVAAGRSRFLYLWTLDSRRLLRVLELPSRVSSVRDVMFISSPLCPTLLACVCSDGITRVFDVTQARQIYEIGSSDLKVRKIAVTVRNVAAMMDDGSLRLYDAKRLGNAPPPPPKVKVIDTQCTPKEQPKQNDILREQPASVKLSRDRLLAILKGFGEFPAKYRLYIWRNMLDIPENHQAFASLVDRGLHSNYANLHKKLPLKNTKLLRQLQRVLSALSHWSIIFGEVDYLPSITFPFVKLFENNQLLAFEITATFIMNWCSHWFEFFPNPPINILTMTENILAAYDRHLLKHYIDIGVTAKTYAWPLLQSVFSEVLTREEWLRLFDHVLMNPLGWLLAAVVMYNSINRSTLMRIKDKEDMEFFFRHQNAIDLRRMIRDTYRVVEATQCADLIGQFEPLSEGQYPLFNKYPKYIVDYQVQERERIRAEEEAYLRARDSALVQNQETLRRQHSEEAFYRHQGLLAQAEQRRRKIIEEEERKLTDQRARLAAMTRELRLNELRLLDSTRRKFMDFEQQKMEQHLARMDDEIRSKGRQREVETQQAVEEMEIRNLELDIQKRLLEQELHRGLVDQQTSTQREISAKQHKKAIAEIVEQSRREAQHRKQAQNMQEHIISMAHGQRSSRSARTVGWEEEEAEEMGQKTQRKLKGLEQENLDLQTRIQHLMQDITQSAAPVEDQSQVSGNDVPSVDGVEERILNDSSATASTTQFSVERDGREEFEDSERHLMEEVRRLRRKLAEESTHRPKGVSA